MPHDAGLGRRTFPAPAPIQNSKGNPISGGVKYTGGVKIGHWGGAQRGASVHVTRSANECRASVRIHSGHYYNEFDFDKDLLYKQSDVRFRSADFSENVRQPGQECTDSNYYSSVITGSGARPELHAGSLCAGLHQERQRGQQRGGLRTSRKSPSRIVNPDRVVNSHRQVADDKCHSLPACSSVVQYQQYKEKLKQEIVRIERELEGMQSLGKHPTF